MIFLVDDVIENPLNGSRSNFKSPSSHLVGQNPECGQKVFVHEIKIAYSKFTLANKLES
jgi:hypothetical protein